MIIDLVHVPYIRHDPLHVVDNVDTLAIYTSIFRLQNIVYLVVPPAADEDCGSAPVGWVGWLFGCCPPWVFSKAPEINGRNSPKKIRAIKTSCHSDSCHSDSYQS